MSLSTFLALFLLVDMFFVGVLVSVAVQHARTHFETTKPSAENAETVVHPNEVMTPVMRAQLVRESQKHFEETVSKSVSQLQQNLGATASELDQLLRRLGGEIVGNELERYRVELGQLRQRAQADLGAIKTEVTAHQAELEKQAADEVAAEKQRLIKQIDARLNDAVSSFLVEALQHHIDLGAQEEYLTRLLEEHKQDFMKEVGDEQQPA